MGARADLLATAEGLASAARQAFQPEPTGVGDLHAAPSPEKAAALATAAKTALEAAALAENTGGGAIDQALSQIQDLLEGAGVLHESMELPPAEFLERTFRALLAWRTEALGAQGFEVAYDTLRDLLEGLERDFTAGGSDISLRIAGRIRSRLDDATQIINRGKQGATDGSTEG